MHDSLKYLDFIRGKFCCVSGLPAIPHHLKAVGMSRNRKKPIAEHYTAIPLDPLYHTELHLIGLKSFEKKYQINLWKVSALLQAEYQFNKGE